MILKDKSINSPLQNKIVEFILVYIDIHGLQKTVDELDNVCRLIEFLFQDDNDRIMSSEKNSGVNIGYVEFITHDDEKWFLGIDGNKGTVIIYLDE